MKGALFNNHLSFIIRHSQFVIPNSPIPRILPKIHYNQKNNMKIGTPFNPSATRVMLLGSGFLGKEVIIALQRFGVETIAVDCYPHAPAHQVAHRRHVIDLTHADALRELIAQEQPQFIVPEKETIATDVLIEIEPAGLAQVIPTARAASLSVNHQYLRQLATEELDLPTVRYAAASSYNELQMQINRGVGYPSIVKPVISCSSKGHSVVKGPEDVKAAWDYAVQVGTIVVR
jgi:phosphoribosylglycinamide formyltransferase 2